MTYPPRSVPRHWLPPLVGVLACVAFVLLGQLMPAAGSQTSIPATTTAPTAPSPPPIQ